MGRKLTPKCKQCRRIGEKLFLKGEKCFGTKCPIVKRNYPPGLHGPNKRGSRLSEFAVQLREKQKAKAMYRLMERQFFKYYKQASRSRSETGAQLLRFLETRLDNAIFRLGLAISRDQARQLVSHGHVFVNGRRVDIPSYQLRRGDKITIKAASQEKNIIKDNLNKKKSDSVPGWLDFDMSSLAAQVINEPQANELELGINTRLIIEYYSR